MTWPFGHHQAVPDDRTEAERRVERVVAEALGYAASRGIRDAGWRSGTENDMATKP